MLAATVHPCLELETDEAKAMAKALANVQRYYPNVRLLSDKHAAIVGLMVCTTRIYGKRALILAGSDIASLKKPGKKKAQPIEPGGNVYAHPAAQAAPSPVPGAPMPTAEDAAHALVGLAPPQEPEPWSFS